MALLGINPNEAAAAGGQAATTSDGFKLVQKNFNDSCSNAGEFAGEAPVIKGLETYREEHQKPLGDIAEHGHAVGTNTRAGAAKGVWTDTDLADGFLLAAPQQGEARYDALKSIGARD